VVAYEEVMRALADATRREIFERLARRPQAVGELASALPVSRPAVSQHLRVLKEAGLASEQRDGARRVYRVELDGLAELRAYVEAFWSQALDSFKEAAESDREERTMSAQTALPAVRQSVTVDRTPEDAFRVFTEEIGSWWPLQPHSVGGAESTTVVMESRPGGRLYERTRAGDEHDWGEIRAWEPPRRVAFSWHPGADPAEATDVEVRFTPVDGATHVELEHRGWERLGERAEAARRGYASGWPTVLARYEDAAVG
jgi:DNA-binding transcriptional ArsR family regulator/uncharacterized protein YndB with AHSA1/START domain